MAGISIPGGVTNKNENGIYTWEKTVKDANNIDEIFSNARDVGSLRTNYSRLNVIGQLSKYDSVDIYKFNVLSRGKLSLSIKTGDAEKEKILDLSKYEDKIDELMAITDPKGYAEKLRKKSEETNNKDLLEINAPGLKVQIYMKKGNKEILIGDSTAEKGNKKRDTFDKILTGDYRAAQGDYYVKVERDDTISSKKELPYVMQAKIGSKHKHEYVVREASSDDTKNKKISTTSTTSGYLSQADILQIQASKYAETSTMLSIGYLNMAEIYNKNSKY